jgi:CRISPR-associated protein Cas1
MRRMLNTLYVTTDGAYLRKDGENVVVTVDDAERLRVPIHLLGGVIGIGRVSLSSSLMGACAEAGVTVSFLSSNGRFLARVEGPVSGNILLRREQYRRADDPAGCGGIVRSIVAAKAANQRGVLQRSLRDYGDTMEAVQRDAIDSAQARLKEIARHPSGRYRGSARHGGRSRATLFRRLSFSASVGRRRHRFSGAQPAPAAGPGQCPAFISVHPSGA